MSSFIFSLNATVPVFAVIVIGNLLCKIGLIDEHFASISNKFVFRACLPCMIFLDLADTNIRRNFDAPYIGFCFIINADFHRCDLVFGGKANAGQINGRCFCAGIISQQCGDLRCCLYSKHIWDFRHGTIDDHWICPSLQYLCGHHFDLYEQ